MPSHSICVEPGVVVPRIPVAPLLPYLVTTGILLIGPDLLRLVDRDQHIGLLAVAKGRRAVGPDSIVENAVLDAAWNNASHQADGLGLAELFDLAEAGHLLTG